MQTYIRLLQAVSILIGAVAFFSIAAADDAQVPAGDLARIRAACPAAPAVKPERPRRVLIYSKWRAFRHDSIPWGAAAMRILGEKTEAFEPVLSADSAVFEPETLAKFDVVIFNNNCEKGIDEPRRRRALFDFVKNGGGIVGIHSASYDPNWPEFIELLGACSVDHPWNSGSTVSVRVTEQESPLVKPFGKGPFRHTDEIFTYSHFNPKRSRILLVSGQKGDGYDACPASGKKRSRFHWPGFTTTEKAAFSTVNSATTRRCFGIRPYWTSICAEYSMRPAILIRTRGNRPHINRVLPAACRAVASYSPRRPALIPPSSSPLFSWRTSSWPISSSRLSWLPSWLLFLLPSSCSHGATAPSPRARPACQAPVRA